MGEPVPAAEINCRVRENVREYCAAMQTGRSYTVPAHRREAWMPTNMDERALLCVQRNARKDRTLFDNVFYLKALELGSLAAPQADFTKFENVYIVGLQSELPRGKGASAALLKNIKELERRMGHVEEL